MKFLDLLVIFTVAVSAAPKQHPLWEQFKSKHGKTYKNASQEAYHSSIFANQMDLVDKHNARYAAGEVHFQLGMNSYSDVDHAKFVSDMNGYQSGNPRLSATVTTTIKPSGTTARPSTATNTTTTSTTTTTTTAAPVITTLVDWRTKGAVTPIKDQGQCGSCWTFSSTGALEGQNFLKTKNLVSLSEQNLLDCSSNAQYGNNGCGGGWMGNAFQYVIDNKGIDTEASYPYQTAQGTCRYSTANIGGIATTYSYIAAGDENALMNAVATIGPIATAIDASHPSFQAYSSGVYTEPACDPQNLDHAVLIVGYGHDSVGGDYWLVKNSWGTTWGENGYIRMARNQNNHCGIATDAIKMTI